MPSKKLTFSIGEEEHFIRIDTGIDGVVNLYADDNIRFHVKLMRADKEEVLEAARQLRDRFIKSNLFIDSFNGDELSK
jgi:hypothetical protein